LQQRPVGSGDRGNAPLPEELTPRAEGPGGAARAGPLARPSTVLLACRRTPMRAVGTAVRRRVHEYGDDWRFEQNRAGALRTAGTGMRLASYP